MVNPVTTYDSLTSALVEASFDDSAEFQAFLPVAVANAEIRLSRELDNLGLVVITTVSANPSVPGVLKPTGCRVIHSVVYIDPTTSRRSVLRNKTDDYLYEYWPQPSSVGTPIYYSSPTDSTINICPCVSVTAGLEFTYEMRPAALSVSNQTNYFTNYAADALFYASMIELAIYQRNDALLQQYAQMYQAARDSLNNEGRRQRRDDSDPVGNTEAGQNTLLGDKKPD
jgi:hypothetical protein